MSDDVTRGRIAELEAEVTRLTEALRLKYGDTIRAAVLAERKVCDTRVGILADRISWLEAEVAHRAKQMAHDAARITELEAERDRLMKLLVDLDRYAGHITEDYEEDEIVFKVFKAARTAIRVRSAP